MSHRFQDYNNGNIYKKVSAFWFTLLGYVAAIVAIELVAKEASSLAIMFVAKLSYVFIFLWLKAKIDDAIWWWKPEYHPDHEFSSKKENFRVLWRGGRLSAIACVAIYYFVEHVIEVIVAAS